MLKLDAINQMLGGIGQTPVSSPTSQNPAVLSAVATLNRIDKKLQSKGWYFNTDYTLTLSYNSVTKDVIVPGNTLSVDPSDASLPYVLRGTRLYNQNEATFEIGTNVDVTLIQLIDFEELPELAAAAIAAAATVQLVLDLVGDNIKLQYLMEERRIAFVDLKIEDIKWTNKRVTTNPSVSALISGIRPVR